MFWFLKTLKKAKPKQPKNIHFFGFETFCIIWGRIVSFRKAADHPATFSKINVPTQLFLCFIIDQMVPNCKTLHMCFFAISGNFVTRFSGNVFSQDCSGHSVKCNVWEKVSC